MIRSMFSFAMDVIEATFTDDPNFEPVNPEWMGIKFIVVLFFIAIALESVLSWFDL
jgi:hypothetical protein